MIRVSVILAGLIVASAACASDLNDAYSKCMAHSHLVKDGRIARLTFDPDYGACDSILVARHRHDALVLDLQGMTMRPAATGGDAYVETPAETAAVHAILVR